MINQFVLYNQNVHAAPETDPKVIKENLVAQLTAPVRWTQSVQKMAEDGAQFFTEVGPGKVLQGLVKKINKELEVSSAEINKTIFMISKRNRLLALLIFASVVLDQASKILIRNYIDRYQSISLIGEYFTLTNVENPGAFLGMGSDLSPSLKLVLLLILPVIVLGIVMYKLFTETTLDKWSTIGFASIIGWWDCQYVGPF